MRFRREAMDRLADEAAARAAARAVLTEGAEIYRQLEREALRLEALALHERHLNGELGPAEYERLLADLGKPDDDLTRYQEVPG